MPPLGAPPDVSFPAVQRATLSNGLNVIVLERHGQIGVETSSRNSEVIHAGIYYPTGSAKAALRRGMSVKTAPVAIGLVNSSAMNMVSM